MTVVATTTRSTLGLPVERIAQLKSLADARQTTPAALVERWIMDAVARGDDGAIPLPGYVAVLDDDTVFVEIAGHALPAMKPDRARLLAAVLSGAAGHTDPKLEFAMPTGRAVPVELGNGAKIVVGRHGRGVVFVLTSATGEQTKFAAPPSFVAELADDIRRELNVQ